MEDMISIIVPVYNAEKTLERCVKSLRKQSYQNIEIILVNDGSKDDSLVLCRLFAAEDTRIRVINKPNGGVSSARNAGLDTAQGDFIMFCDSDDWVESNWCESMLANWTEEDFVVCRIARDDIPDEQAPQAPRSQVPRKEFMHRPMEMCALYNKLFVGEIIRNNNLRFHKELRLGEDLVFVLEYLCHSPGNICYVERKLYNYDTSSDGLSKKAQTLQQCELFYTKMTTAMECIDALDSQSIYHRDWHVMTQLENMLIAVSIREDLTIKEKWKIAADTQKAVCFQECSGDVITWRHPLYHRLLRNKNAKGIMAFLLVRRMIKGSDIG